MDQPPRRPTRAEDVNLDADEFNWIIPSQRRNKGVMDKIKECYAEGVDMTQFYGFQNKDYKIPKFQEALDKKRGVYKAPQAPPQRPSRGRSSSRPPPVSDAAPRRRGRNTSVPPPVSYTKRDDPVTDKTNDMVVVATRIKNGEDPGGLAGSSRAQVNARAVISLVIPGAVCTLDNLLDASQSGYTLPELTPQALLDYYCDCAEECHFYTAFQVIDVKDAVRRGVQAPDELRTEVNCEECPSCVSRKNELESIKGKKAKQQSALGRAAYKQHVCTNRKPETVRPKLALRRASHRVAAELLKLERKNLEGVEGDALVERLRPRAVYSCVERQETNRRAGRLSDWRPGLRASLLARRSGVMFYERSTSEQYNNDPRFIALRANEGYMQATCGSPLQRA